MAAYENNNSSNEVSGKAKSYNRSLTTRNPHSNPYLYSSVLNRAGSFNKHSDSKVYNSIESVVSAGNSWKGKVKKLCSIFEAGRHQNSPAPAAKASPKPDCNSPRDLVSDVKKSSIRLLGCEDRIVLYFTSLRGVRRTFEDCYAVRMIFKGFRVWVDERDISMDAGYRKELQNLFGAKNVSLPQIFIRGEHIGGADVIKGMYETGELAKLLGGFPKQKPGFFCDSCGDVRFVPCSNCDGSRKVFDEDEGTLKRCSICNENGLIRCPDCCM